MFMTNKFLEIRNKLTKIEKSKHLFESEVPAKVIKKEGYSLDKKVDDYIKWYTKTFVKGNYTDSTEFLLPKKMKNLIEKMAVWYELRYPEYDVNTKYPCCGQENIDSSKIFIQENKEINEIIDLLGLDKELFNKALEEVNWSSIMSKDAYFKSLTWDEKWFLMPNYRLDIVYVNKLEHFHLDSNGIVIKSEIIKKNMVSHFEYYDFKGWHILDALEYLKLENYDLDTLDVKQYMDHKKLVEDFFNCVMYRIIDRGENRIGPRRAFMFALEFGLDIDIPMMYGIDSSDPGLRMFINEYIKSGGDKNLNCLIKYWRRTSDNQALETKTIIEILKEQRANVENKYTEEEKLLAEQFINLINIKKRIMESNKAAYYHFWCEHEIEDVSKTVEALSGIDCKIKTFDNK